MAGRRGRAALALALSAAIGAAAATGPGRALETVLGEPLLHEIAPTGPAEGVAIVALDQGSVDWLRFAAPELETRAPALAACLPGSARRELETLRNPSDLPRALHACLVERLGAAGARTIVFDVLFHVPRAGDARLAEAIARSGRVLLLEGIERHQIEFARRRPRPELAEAADGTGTFVLVTGAQGRVLGYRTATPFPGLSDMPALAAMRAGTTPGPRQDPQAIRIPGAARTLATVTLRALWEDGAALAGLGGATLFVGRSETGGAGTEDHFPAPGLGGGAVAGVEIAAAATRDLLRNRAPWRPAAPALALAAAAGAAAALLPGLLFAGPGAAAAALGGAAAWTGLAAAAYAGPGIILPLAIPLAVAAPLAVLLALARSLGLARRALSALAPRSLGGPDAGGDPSPRTEDATVLFVDIMGSTAEGASLRTDAFAALLERHYEAVDRAVTEEGGVVMEFQGDGVIALFAADRGRAPHAARAVAAARALAAAARSPARPPDTPRLRMGLHSGPVSLGRFGTDRRHSYKAVGLPVAIAARIETHAKSLPPAPGDARATILLSAETARGAALPDAALEPAPPLAMPGSAAPLALFRLRDL